VLLIGLNFIEKDLLQTYFCKMCYVIVYPHVTPNLYDFLSSIEHKRQDDVGIRKGCSKKFLHLVFCKSSAVLKIQLR